MPQADPHPRFVKLVRDRIAKYLGKSEVIYAKVPSEELVPNLRRKLLEEAGEYLMNPTLGELADVLEVVKALAQHDLQLGSAAFAKVVSEAFDKRCDRGGYDSGIGMYVTATAGPRHEGEHGLG